MCCKGFFSCGVKRGKTTFQGREEGFTEGGVRTGIVSKKERERRDFH